VPGHPFSKHTSIKSRVSEHNFKKCGKQEVEKESFATIMIKKKRLPHIFETASISSSVRYLKIKYFREDL
jgi:hypothetical protein